MIAARRIVGPVVWVALAVAARTAGAADQKVPKPVVEVGPAEFHATTPYPATPKRADLVLAAPRLPAGARHDLGPLSDAERARLTAPERGGGARTKRVRIGLSRPLPSAVGFPALPADVAAGTSRTLGGGLLERAADGSLAWTASFSSAGAGGVRLYVSTARLPTGSLVYVYGGADEIHGPYDFGSGTRPEGFWTNTVHADTIVLEVRIPAGADAAALSKAFLVVGNVVHLEHPLYAPLAKASPPATEPTCYVDRACVTVQDWPGVVAASNAVAQLNFSDQGSEYVCTGGLINTSPSSNIPYLLTANHCFDNQAAATSLEATWQYRRASCNGPVPDESQFPTTLGSTLLATANASTSSDYTFVQLSQNPPAGSVQLGWTTADLLGTSGLVGYRLSYPLSANQAYVVPQVYTREQLVAVSDAQSCAGQGVPQSRFLYETDI